MIENKSNQYSISVNSRHSGVSSHKVLVSPRSSKFLGQFSAGQIKNTKEYRQKASQI